MNDAIKTVGKLIVNSVQKIEVAAGRTLGFIDFPVPLNSSMRKTGGKSIHGYYISGIRCYLPIATMALNCGVKLHSTINVLDFGCGVGRQLVHFTRDYPKPKYHACDVDPSAMNFIERNYPSAVSRTNLFSPPLPFEADSMDMIYSVSTFSHLNPEDQKIWLKELYRITRPGGYCFLTTEGWKALESLRYLFPDADTEGKLRSAGILYKEYPEFAKTLNSKASLPALQHMLGIDRSYGSTVMTPEFIRENWVSQGFDLKAIVEGVIDNRQDLVVLHKPR
jgi:SAM-dependent methyltransferase